MGRRNDQGRIKKEFLKLCWRNCGSQSIVGSGLSLLPDASPGTAMIAPGMFSVPPITRPTTPRASYCATEEKGIHLPRWYSEDVADARAPDCWDSLSNHPASDQEQKPQTQTLGQHQCGVGAGAGEAIAGRTA